MLDDFGVQAPGALEDPLASREKWNTSVPATVTRSSRLRGMVRTHRFAAAAAVLLLTAGAATLFVPMAGGSCANGFRSLTARPATQPTDTSPQPDPATAEADDKAIADAQGAINQANSAVADAQAAQDAAASLQSKADDAASAASAADSASGTPSVDLEQDQNALEWDKQEVQSANDALTSAQEGLQSAKDTLTTDQQLGLDTSYDTQSIADAKAQITQAQSDLKTAQTTVDADTAKIAKDQKSVASAAAASKTATANAESLAKRAEDAQTKADSQLSGAQERQSSAQADLSSAQSTQAAHQAADLNAAAVWHHEHRLAVFAVDAKNSTMTDCRLAATKNAGVGAGLAVSGTVLLLVDVVSTRRRRVALRRTDPQE
ncbi:hypothetical protein [Terrabacter sp. Ter38]|uniref:hypothetical protein n=1 Tax=Terrabacter sp. Ter38 TaxID=2926030 RepID=UPI00211778F4|nr:hypothetical protein [Terrabacter sp. Ter38]